MTTTIRVTAPDFVAAVLVGRDAAPILRFMRGWSVKQILAHCKRNGWKAEVESDGSEVPATGLAARTANHGTSDSLESLMNDIDPAVLHAFDTAQNAKEVGDSYFPRLPDGDHIVVLTRFGGKASQSNLGTILEADFVVEQSNACQPGARHGQPWFPQMSGWGGAYQSKAYRNFTEAVDQSVGNPIRDVKTTGIELARGIFRGIRLRVIVTPAINKKNGQRMTDSKGRPLSDAMFSPMQQTMQDIQARQPTLPPDPVRQPRQPQTQQFQGAPHPSQMPNQYPAQQGYPQQPQQYAPPQQGYQQQPQYAPPVQPQQQYAPPAQQQYAPPTQPGYPQQPPAQQQYAPPAPPQQGYPQQPPAQQQYAPPAQQQYAPPAPPTAPAQPGGPPSILQGLR